jgi:hypothetical protein
MVVNISIDQGQVAATPPLEFGDCFDFPPINGVVLEGFLRRFGVG